MSRRGGLLTIALFFTILFAGIDWAEAADPFEPWEGKATTGLNVRQSPIFGSRIMAWLRKEEKVKIVDEKEKWYKIIFEIEGQNNQEGWVHSKYIQRIFPEKKDVASALNMVKSETKTDELEEIPLEASANQGPLPGKQIKEDLSQSSESAITQVVEEKSLIASQKALLRGEAAMTNVLPEKDHVLKEDAPGDFQRDSPAPEIEGSAPHFAPEAVPVISRKSDTPAAAAVLVGEKTTKKEPVTFTDGKGAYDAWGFNDLIKLSVRLLAVAFSCLAILLSYKAIKLAKISYNAAMQFQRNLQVGRQRGDARMG